MDRTHTKGFIGGFITEFKEKLDGAEARFIGLVFEFTEKLTHTQAIDERK